MAERLAEHVKAVWAEMRRPMSLRDRLMPKIEKDTASGCWLWKGATRADGYGILSSGARQLRARRVAYELLVGPIPDGLTIDHLCRNRACVNPDHLEPVTPAENKRRGLRGERRNSCWNGHPYTPESVGTATTGRRYCRICKREYMRKRYARQQAERRGLASRAGCKA